MVHIRAEKVNKLKDTYGLKLTKEVESEVSEMCSYATAMETKGIERGIEKGIEKGIEQGKITARYEDGMSIEKIAEKSKVSVEYVKEILIQNGMLK
jgi:predicted transposase YdaD